MNYEIDIASYTKGKQLIHTIIRN